MLAHNKADEKGWRCVPKTSKQRVPYLNTRQHKARLGGGARRTQPQFAKKSYCVHSQLHATKPNKAPVTGRRQGAAPHTDPGRGPAADASPREKLNSFEKFDVKFLVKCCRVS